MPMPPGTYGLPKGLGQRSQTQSQAAAGNAAAEAPAAEDVTPASPEVINKPTEEAKPDYRIPHSPDTGGQPEASKSEVDEGSGNASQEESAIKVASKTISFGTQLRALLGQSTAAQLVLSGAVFLLLLALYRLAGNQQPPDATTASLSALDGFASMDVDVPDGVTLTEDDVYRMGKRNVETARGSNKEPSISPFPDDSQRGRTRHLAPKDAPKTHRNNTARPSEVSPNAADTIVTPKMVSEMFYRPGGTLAVLQTTSGAAALKLDVGTSFSVALQVGLSSSHYDVVLARVTEDVVAHGAVVLKKGDIVKGRATNDGERIFIDFYEVAASSKLARIACYATEGGLPGVVAAKRKATAQERSRASAVGGAMDVVKSAVNAAAAAASGGLPGQVASSVASNAAGQSITELQRDLVPNDGVILQLTQGRQFQVVVTGE